MNRIRIFSLLLITATTLFLFISACDELITERIENTLTGYPKANFDADKLSCCRPCTVKFFQKADGPRDEYIWSFGDGDSAFVENPTHVYTSVGTFNVRLLVRDLSNNNEDDEIKLNYITITDSLLIDFTAQTDTCCLPCSLQFFDNSSSCNALTYLWHFGDGDSSTEMDPIHYYTTEGSFDVKLTIRDTLAGIMDTLTKPGLVYILDTLDADFTAPVDTCCLPCSLQFSDNSYAPCREPAFVWDFGDGDSSTAKDPLHIYDSAGTFDVSLQINDTISLNQDTETKLGFVYVIDTLPDSANADFSITPATGDTSITYTFMDLTGGEVFTWFWDFGDSVSSVLENPSHKYDSAGTYTVRMILTNPCDSVEKIKTLIVTN